MGRAFRHCPRRAPSNKGERCQCLREESRCGSHMLCVAVSGARAQGGQMPLHRCARGPTGARGAGDRTMLVEQLAESTPPREQLGGSAGGSCPPGGRRDAVPRVIPAVSCSPRRHTRRLSPSRSSTALSCSGCLASIKPHRRAFPSHRKWSSRRLPQPALSRS
jgi:hypothetical protein